MNMLGRAIRVNKGVCSYGCCCKYRDVFDRTLKRERAREEASWRRELRWSL